ncbi:hypothetical protein VCRA2113O20_30071 [Vibrio crassostreae]|nr:hypothetical protein VCRA2113O20_30071 [Vibrio crassostreae]CAK2144721.1 hypothetical protein VCRA2117O39_40246 [Vibrio crassostreae]CAK2516810.1 hypothetical protein VCRA2116O32_40071 [Vibrio crassostreae]CAK3032365.1 hypothetical protein VCRA2120O56_40071 [Vibrio crassostreae]CAK3561272.1 hypothetical protein VCRA2121O70_40071 [Vibrio crassostreae]
MNNGNVKELQGSLHFKVIRIELFKAGVKIGRNGYKQVLWL